MFRLGWFLGTGFGVYGWNGLWSGNVRSDVGRPELFADMAAALERAGFDYMMLEDSSVVPDVFRGTMEHSLSKGIVRFDPLPLVPLLTERTSHIGVIATIATTFYPPFLAARLFTTLDHLTGGRVGINLVTASPHAAAQNYGMERLPEHDLRYDMAGEWMDVVGQLWESWEPDAVVADPASGVYTDHTRVNPISFKGRFHASRGPLNTVPGPQRRPVVCQAGGSPAGRELAAAQADTVVSAVVGVEAMKEFRDDMARRIRSHGRDPGQVKILFLVDPVLGDTDRSAQDKQDRKQAAARSDLESALAGMSYVSGMDFSRFDPDAPLPDLSSSNGHQSSVADYQRYGKGKTLREVIATRRISESIELVGSPETVAGQMAEAMEHAGGDGFLIASAVTRRNIAQIADGLAPALRRRGLIRDGYRFKTFRENLLDF